MGDIINMADPVQIQRIPYSPCNAGESEEDGNSAWGANYSHYKEYKLHGNPRAYCADKIPHFPPNEVSYEPDPIWIHDLIKSKQLRDELQRMAEDPNGTPVIEIDGVLRPVQAPPLDEAA